MGKTGVVRSAFNMARPLRISVTTGWAGYFLPLNSTVKLSASPPTAEQGESVPVGSMKKPVPDISPCSSTPRIFTTALHVRSKTSLTSRLMEEADWSGSCACNAEAVRPRRKATLQPTATEWPNEDLESQR